MDEIESWLEEDALARTLLEKSSLNLGILKALLLFYWNEDVNFRKIAEKLNLKKPGAWKRWKKGLNTIINSFYTIELAVYSGILDTEIAELLAEDLKDYVDLYRKEGNREAIQRRLERRMIELKTKVMKQRGQV